MRDTLLILGGMLMGGGLTYVREAAWREFQEWRRARREGPQWFTPSEAARPAPPPPGGPQPTPRPIRGQRPAQGAHRATQQTARFSGRVRRAKVVKPAHTRGSEVESADASPGLADGD